LGADPLRAIRRRSRQLIQGPAVSAMSGEELAELANATNDVTAWFILAG
jgi:hypothetical protein